MVLMVLQATKPVSRAVVSAVSGGLSLLTDQLDLPTLDDLTRLCEAVLFHDEVIYFSDIVQGPFIERFIDESSETVRASIRYDYHESPGSQLSAFLQPFAPGSLATDAEDCDRALRAMRHVDAPRIHLPSRPRSLNEWIALPGSIQGGFAKAELRLSAQLGATYYPTPRGASAATEAVAVDRDAALSIARRFARLRARELQRVSKHLGRWPVPFQPPLILAYAVASANSIDGFFATLRDLRSDTRVERLRRFASRLSEMPPSDLIVAGKEIDVSIRRILVPKAASPSRLLRPLFSIVDLAAAGSLKAVLEFGAGLLDSMVGVRRHLAVLDQLHRTVPSAKDFYADLSRVFGHLSLICQPLFNGSTIPLSPTLRPSFRPIWPLDPLPGRRQRPNSALGSCSQY